MHIRENLKAILVTALSGFYLFVVLFSQMFHQHGSGSEFRDFHFKKSENNISAKNLSASESNCLSCHFLHEGYALVPQSFQYDFLEIRNYYSEIAGHQFIYLYKLKEITSLRGPPVC